MEHGALPIFCSVVSATKPPKDVQLNTDIVVAVHTREDDVSDDEHRDTNVPNEEQVISVREDPNLPLEYY